MIAFHGTSKANAKAILRQRFILSRNHYDWLGSGVYFFDHEGRAQEWASRQFGAQGAVVRAIVDASRIVDLTNPEWSACLADFAEAFIAKCERCAISLPENHAQLDSRPRDCLMVNAFFHFALREAACDIAGVRMAFEHGEPTYPGSNLRNASHVQIAVRDVEAITDTHTQWLA